jgi:DNA-binding MarR family transcriptional regulator
MSASEQPPRPTAASVTELPSHNNLGHLLWETAARGLVFSESVLRELPLSPPSIGALEMIGAFPGMTASELARHAFKTQQAASQLTSRLQRLGYIEGRLGAGRGVGLFITAAGEAALTQGIAGELEVERQFSELLGAERYGELRALLHYAREQLIDAAADVSPADG